MPTPPVTVHLNATATVALRFDTRAEYRLSSIGRTADLSDWQSKAKKFAFLCDWLWACALDCAHASPEALAATIDRDKIGGLVAALFAAIDAGIGGKDAPDAAQKKSTSPAGPLIASPSA
jgi:hypothetical protein